MQLLIILALLLYGGKTDAGKLLNEVTPLLETFGGDEVKEALNSVEQISGVLSAVREFAGGVQAENNATGGYSQHTQGVTGNPDIAFPLAPISNIADREITYSLSKYISQNA